MNLILFDHPTIRQNLLPFTFTRPVAGIRVGIFTIAEKWEKLLGLKASFSAAAYLAKKFPAQVGEDNLWVNGAVCPDEAWIALIKDLKMGEAVRKGTLLVAVRTADNEVPEIIDGKVYELAHDITVIDQVWKIFQYNGAQIKADFARVVASGKSKTIDDPFTRVYNQQNIFLEDGVVIKAAVLNAEDGPIYLGKNSQVQEGALIKGPFSLGESSVVNMGAKIRGDTTVGPFSKVGGEISNAVLFGYSNKGHDGFLGNSVLGEWCNLGADTNTSNLKNNYDQVKLWNYPAEGFKNTGLTFCGLMMGDHSKCGINTMFNTGTVVGVSANIFGDGYPRNFIPSFAWGGAAGFTTYQLSKAFETASRSMERRSVQLTEADRQILQYLFDESAKFRVWEKK